MRAKSLIGVDDGHRLWRECGVVARPRPVRGKFGEFDQSLAGATTAGVPGQYRLRNLNPPPCRASEGALMGENHERERTFPGVGTDVNETNRRRLTVVLEQCLDGNGELLAAFEEREVDHAGCRREDSTDAFEKRRRGS